MAMKAVVNVGAGLLIIYLLSTFDMNGVSFIPILAVIAVLGGAIGMSYLTQGESSYVDDDDSETEEDEYIELKAQEEPFEFETRLRNIGLLGTTVNKIQEKDIVLDSEPKVITQPSKKLSAFEQAEALRLRTDNKQGETK